QMHGKRELEYLSYVGASDQTAKEVRLFSLSDFLVGRFRAIADKLYSDNRSLQTKRSMWGTILAIVGHIGYYIAFIYIILGVVRGSLSIGSLVFLLGSIRQLGVILISGQIAI
ncbi:MAG: ABC transporter ATP-binding protein, partial [Chitinophagaceae bacterium]